MKRILTLVVAAAVVLVAVPSATAGDPGRTVCVMRNRPVAICPPRVITHSPRRYVSQQIIGRRSMPSWQSGRYGNFAGRPFSRGFGYGGFGNGGFSVRPNGYVGGLRNLPSNVIQIPHTFGRGHHHGHSHGNARGHGRR